jgi:hypothetical protein
MRKLLCVTVLFVIMIGTVSGVASAKTLYVVAEDILTNDTQTPADAFAVDVKLTTYNNQCMTLTFSAQAAVAGVTTATMGFVPTIDGIPVPPTLAGTTWWVNAEYDMWDTAGFMWQMCGLKIGRHAVRIKFLPEVGGNIAYVGPRILKIEIKSGKIVPLVTGAGLEDE